MRYSGSLAVLFATAFVALGLRPEAETPHAALDVAVTRVYDAVVARSAAAACIVNCNDAPGACGVQCEHRAPQVIGRGSHDEGLRPHSWCFEGICEMRVGSCISKHALCNRSSGFDASLAALDAADFAELHAIMDTGAGIRVLWEHGLLAFYDCADRVVASVVLTGQELAALAVAEGQLR